MWFYTRSMISFDVLVEINKNPEKYTLNSRQGRHNLYDLALTLSTKQVKSIRGTFEQAKIIGFCIAAGWDKKNKAFIAQDTENSIRDLLFLNNFVLRTTEKSKFLYKQKTVPCIESALLKGFRQGYTLGICYAQRKKVHYNNQKITNQQTPFRYFKIPQRRKKEFQR